MSLPPGLTLPTAVQTLWWIRRPIELMGYCRKRYGDTFSMKLAATGTMVMTCDPACVKQVFTGDGDQLRAGEVNDVLEPIVGQHSVLLLDGARHLRQRRLMLPPFHGERMKLYAQVMHAITLERLQHWPTGRAFALRDETQAITLDVVLRTIFGVPANEMSELRTRLERMIAIAGSPLALLGLVPMFRLDFPGSLWRHYLKRKQHADEQIFHEIAQRRRQGPEQHDDVLSLLLLAKDEDGSMLSDQELRDELMTLLLAGHETTATSICWAFEKILGTEGVYARVQQELDEVCAGEPLSIEHLGKLEYLDAAIKESLRMRPVIPLVGRRLHAPFQLKQWEIPTGAVITPSIYLTHYNPDVYAEPEAFKPERFLGGRPDPYAWFPFGGGVRRCLGMAFALYEMKVVMATIMSRMQLELAQPVPIRVVRRAITFTPEHGMRIRAQPRSAASSAGAALEAFA